jgi:arsenite-transporting ATPase
VLAARLAGERQQIERIDAGLAQRVFTLPWLKSPPIGLAALSALVRAP